LIKLKEAGLLSRY